MAVSSGSRPDVATRQRRAAWLGPLVFLAYGAAEVAIGSWAFVLLTGRGLGTAAAGISVTALLGGAGRRPAGPGRRGTADLAGPGAGRVGGRGGGGRRGAVGAAHAGRVGRAVLLGLSLAGMFPALMALTPARVGPGAHPHGHLQPVGRVVVGGAAWSAAVGLVAQHLGSAAIAPALLASCLLLAVTDVVLTAAST